MSPNAEYASVLQETLHLRWSPVAVRLLRAGEPVPEGVSEPASRLRHCQAITAARRGNRLYMPPRCHACPDGAAIMGLTPMSRKLRSGELYLLFKKLPDLECAQKLISTRPEFPPNSYTASVVAPLESSQFEPDVVIFTLRPEQAMWLCCASTYTSGERLQFHTSGYNSTCADLTVQVMKLGKMNISFGCYGARASSDVDDSEVYLSVPFAQLPALVSSLSKLAKKSIPEARMRIYMPPVADSGVGNGQTSYTGRMKVVVDAERCNGCELCVAFCPEEVLKMVDGNGERKAQSVDDKLCCACYTCVGQCPEKAIQLMPT